ncbi:MAG: DUF4422 domain-containing protein [Salinivirgaceae bacterium]|jgi:hypothetical protein|nr:DUF4422 domain-containing protein [Salinivirgaceae bacterium]
MKDNPNIKIMVCAHKPCTLLNDSVFTPIQVGRERVDFDLGYKTDNIGDNIGSEHFLYGEFTGLYWAWKNVKNVDIIGWNHYSRYFCLEDKKKSTRELILVNEEEFSQMSFSTKALDSILTKYDIILPRKKVLTESNWNRYSRMKDVRNLHVIESIISEKFPDYLSSFYKLLKNTNRLELLCVFITRWELFDDYCAWLFAIFEEANKYVDASHNTLHEERAFAFLGELLFPIYVHHNKLKIKYLPVAWINPNVKNKSWFRYHGSNIKSTIRFWLNI